MKQFPITLFNQILESKKYLITDLPWMVLNIYFLNNNLTQIKTIIKSEVNDISFLAHQ